MLTRKFLVNILKMLRAGLFNLSTYLSIYLPCISYRLNNYAIRKCDFEMMKK